MNNILVVAAHPDDEILGLGGTIRKKIERGDVVDCLILGEGITSRKDLEVAEEEKQLRNLHDAVLRASKIIGFRSVNFENLPDNRFDSLNRLEVVKIIENYLDRLKPKTIFTHHRGDRNIDHNITHDAVLTACRPVGQYSVKEILAFETPSSTEWGFNGKDEAFTPNVFIDITETIDKKIEAFKQYESEIRDYPHPRSIEALEVISRRWGTVVGKKYVEAFELIYRIED